MPRSGLLFQVNHNPNFYFIFSFTCSLGSNMTNLTLFRAAGPPALLTQEVSWMPWFLLTLIGIIALLFGIGMRACFFYFTKAATPRSDPQVWDEALTGNPDSSTSSGHPHHPWSRLPREEISLATFVTRRTNTWNRLQAGARGRVLVVD